jgi:hypothetical protein
MYNNNTTRHWQHVHYSILNTKFKGKDFMGNSKTSGLWLKPPFLLAPAFYAVSVPVVPHRAVAEVSKIGNL